MNYCKRVVIFEGPDGAGKTTLAKAVAKDIDAVYVHCGPFPNVTFNLGRLYAEAMLPALLGYRNVVLDRSWLSEPIYGDAFRGGYSRLSPVDMRMLDRLAWRCAAQVVNCRPPWEVVKENYLSRRAQEMLTTTNQLTDVYQAYREPNTALNMLKFDYTKCLGDQAASVMAGLDRLRPIVHQLDSRSGGNPAAKVVLVSGKPRDIAESDLMYQWPFGSFYRIGYEYWLTGQLNVHGIGEDELLWMDLDRFDLVGESLASNEIFYALGGEAAMALREVPGQEFQLVDHPYEWLKTPQSANQLYPLIELLKRDLNHEI